MAQLFIDLRGFTYEQGLRSLLDAYQAGITRLQEHLDAATLAHDEYEASGEWLAEYDEDGALLWSRDHELRHEIMSTLDARADLRKAIAIAFYHYWERSIRRMCQPKKHDFDGFTKAAIAAGFTISPDLTKAHRLTNALKHNDGKSGGALLSAWPEAFRIGFQPGSAIDWYSAIALDEWHIDLIYNAIANSGPQIKKLSANSQPV